MWSSARDVGRSILASSFSSLSITCFIISGTDVIALTPIGFGSSTVSTASLASTLQTVFRSRYDSISSVALTALLETVLGSTLYDTMVRTFLGVLFSRICNPRCSGGAVRLFERGLLVLLSTSTGRLLRPICSPLRHFRNGRSTDPNLFRR